jgi:hypothetical protein
LTRLFPRIGFQIITETSSPEDSPCLESKNDLLDSAEYSSYRRNCNHKMHFFNKNGFERGVVLIHDKYNPVNTPLGGGDFNILRRNWLYRPGRAPSFSFTLILGFKVAPLFHCAMAVVMEAFGGAWQVDLLRREHIPDALHQPLCCERNVRENQSEPGSVILSRWI